MRNRYQNTFKDDMRVFAAVTAAVSVAVLSGCGIGYAAATKGPSYLSPYTAAPELSKAVRVVSKLAQQASPGLKAPVYFTDLDFVEELGHATSSVRTKGCKVVINNDYANDEFVIKLREYTGWDEKQAAIFLAGHEIQHCITKDDVRKAVFSKSALSEREAHALHTFAWGTKIAENAARHPASRRAVEGLEYVGTKGAYIRANESISDITGALMVQQLSEGGLTIKAVEGLKKFRMEENPNALNGDHHTVPALSVLLTKLHLDESFGKYIAPEHIPQVAYQIAGTIKPESDYTKGTVEGLKKARNAYLATQVNHTAMDI